MDKLGKKLVKEFKRSPAKSIVLVLMVPIAIYFWLPLVTKGWKKSAKPASTVVASTATPTATPPAIDEASLAVANAAASPGVGLPAWDSLVKWMAIDVLTKAATIDSEARNPFKKLEKQQPLEAEPESTPNAAVAETLDLNNLGLHVDTIVVGGRLRTATINGRTFREGDRLKWDGTPLKRQQEFDPTKTLVVTSIEPKQVVLSCGGQQIELELKPLSDLSAVHLK